jgi:hypothetical protein
MCKKSLFSTSENNPGNIFSQENPPVFSYEILRNPCKHWLWWISGFYWWTL